MLPLLRGFDGNETVLFDRGRTLSAASFCAAAVAASARLPRARFAFNLCEGRAEFHLASAAALLAGHTLVLPPSRLARTQDELHDAYPDSYCLVDTPAPAPGSLTTTSFALRPELDGVADETSWPSPSVPAAHVAAILFTSGSTGAPQPHAKSWQTLCEGTQTLLRSFGAPPRGAAILGTVPPQHMFGFETTLMLALQSGTPLLDARPVYPADLAQSVETALALGVDEIWLMSTPLQLRAFHRDLRTLRGVRRIITATMPLERALAHAIERDWNIPVDEIFGCTEGGILATRRPVRSRHFVPAAGLMFSMTAEGMPQVSGGHLSQALPLTDRLQPETPGFGGAGRFEVLGRDDDMVKIAGKRASLRALNRELLAVPGVADGALFLPTSDAPRLAAIVAAPGRTGDEIRGRLANRIDPAFMPRPLVIVTALPRDANGKLPLAELRSLLPVRRAAAKREAGKESSEELNEESDAVHRLEGTALVPADHPAFPGHFPDRPIVPGVVLLELVAALLARNGYRVSECPQVKFLAPVGPATPLSLRIELSQRKSARFTIDVAGKSVVVGKFVCEAGA
jgi:acyl-CoA synthetase (AMP-forming)/AMP-acid ligase II/3-hydroxymyristoyl/3-hydroxydecanoyl-(acyl carrier protein) dehydratase